MPFFYINKTQSHTGFTLAKAFQAMLEHFDLCNKVCHVSRKTNQFLIQIIIQMHALNADNATSNDTQTSGLAQLDNSFEEEHHVWCFNHTIQLLAKALLRPFNPALGKAAEDVVVNDDDDMPDLELFDIDNGNDTGDESANADDDAHDEVDELDKLDATEHEELLESTTVVRGTVLKVCL
jgi:hypothetical protein